MVGRVREEEEEGMGEDEGGGTVRACGGVYAKEGGERGSNIRKGG